MTILARIAASMVYSALRRQNGGPGRRTTGGGPMRVEVDHDSCEANAVCEGLVPEVFSVDDDDRLHIAVGDVPADLADAVRHAVRSCPKAALRVEE
jgi:ferredoxin